MFQQLLEKIAAALDKAGISYMVIGGQAVLLYGEVRMTKDIDITLGLSTSKVKDVLDVIQTIPLKPLVDAETFTKKTMVLPCEDPSTSIRIDLIFSFSPYEREALGRAKNVTLGKHPVKFASLEDLIIHKMVAGRPRDLEDVKALVLKNKTLDTAYVERWLTHFKSVVDHPITDLWNAIKKI